MIIFMKNNTNFQREKQNFRYEVRKFIQKGRKQ